MNSYREHKEDFRLRLFHAVLEAVTGAAPLIVIIITMSFYYYHKRRQSRKKDD
jgi:hypothetical protein